jgi:hypothetical protein
MKKLLALTALMIGTTSMASTVMVSIKTPKATKSWFMPTTINSTTINTVGNTSDHLTCNTTVQGKEFQLLCRQHGMIVLLYRDSTPQKDAILATPKAIVAITTVKGKKK